MYVGACTHAWPRKRKPLLLLLRIECCFLQVSRVEDWTARLNLGSVDRRPHLLKCVSLRQSYKIRVSLALKAGGSDGPTSI